MAHDRYRLVQIQEAATNTRSNDVVRVIYETDEFWAMFDIDEWAKEHLGADAEMIEVSKEGAIQFWLVLVPVAGTA